MAEKTPNRIWFELEYPATGKGSKRVIDLDLAKARAELATGLLRKLGDPITKFWWHEAKECYCVTLDSAGGYKECADNGYWFNLDYMGA